MTPLPMALSQMQHPIKNPLTEFIDTVAGLQVWMFLQLYYLPYTLASKGDDVDQWIKAVSLNGSRWSTICKP